MRLKPASGEKRDNWLLIKSDDAFARPGEDILDEEPRSVKSGRTIEDVAAGKKAGSQPAQKRPREPQKSGKARKRAGKCLISSSPQLATLQPNPPSGEEWLHEVKFDGYRIQAHVADGKAKLFTRKGLDWTGKFGSAISKSLAALDCEDAVIDGEIAVLSDKGVASFSALQAALSAGRTESMLFYVFDLLHLDGEDLRGEPLVERKAEAAQACRCERRGCPCSTASTSRHPGKAMLAHACRMGLEGVVSKRADAPYQSGRSLAWIKSKCTLRQEFVILGYVPSTAAGRGLRSLARRLSRERQTALRRPGRHRLFRHRHQRSEETARSHQDEEAAGRGAGSQGQKGGLGAGRSSLPRSSSAAGPATASCARRPSRVLREDKPAKEVVAETGELGQRWRSRRRRRSESRPAAKSARRKAGTMSVTLTSPEKLLWPEPGISKQDLLDHYEKVWPRMEPFVVNRPLSLVRAPDGVDGQRFFQKHASKGMHEAIIRSPRSGRRRGAAVHRDFDGLAALVQFGVVEIHIWGSTLDAIEKPDQIVFDLDPDEGLDVEDVRAATLDVKERLDALGLPTFVKTSGGKGFHVVVPLKPRADWETVKTFAHDFARAMEQAAPDRYTSVLSKKARKGRIFVDYLRNGRGSTAVAPWSSRGKPKATVAVPVTFEMVKDGIGPADFPIGSKALEDALRRPDPWVDFFKAAKPLKL